MKQHLAILFFCLMGFNLYGQTSYVGYIDKYPIEFVTDVYSDGFARAFYVYTKFDGPISLYGKLEKGLLTLFEKDSSENNKATLIFNGFSPESASIVGTWKDLRSNKELKITLTKSIEIASGEGLAWEKKELLQPVSCQNKYFKIVLSKTADNFQASVIGVKIFEKKTDKLLQEVSLACQLWGLDNISVDDYNFDGVDDFSIFEQSYSGPNTSSLYFLYDPKTDKFFESGFEGTSLEFDPEEKRIHEYNQCCGGQRAFNAEYKLVNNKMVLVKQTCLEYDEKTDDYKEVKCE